MKKRIDLKRLDNLGFKLNHHIDGGDVVVLPLHTKACKKKPCSCGALEAMPKDVVNCQVIWPVRY